MNNYFKKVIHILPIYLLAVFLSIFTLSVLRYLFDYKINLFEIKKTNWNVFLPIIFSSISLILIRKRFWVLEHKNKSKDTFIYIFIAWVTSMILLVSSQLFLTDLLAKNQTVENIETISFDKNVSKIKVKKYYVDTFYSNYKTDVQVAGKDNNDLVFTFYLVSAIAKDSLSDNDTKMPKIWYVDHFSEKISNRLSDREKYEKYKNFKKKTEDNLSHWNYYKLNYFEKVPASDVQENYISLISTVLGENIDKDEVILLTPSERSFNDKGEGILKWFFIFLAICISVFLFSLIFPEYKNPDSLEYKKKTDEFSFVIKFLTPTKDFLITPILIDLNLLVFLIMCLLGIDPINPRIQDLVKLGALTVETAQGEYWRLVTSLFLHGGIMHLFMNMVVLAISGTYAEQLFGKYKLALIYFASGIFSAFMSLIWHQLMVGVGASGAIFGVIGAVTMTIILTKSWKDSKTVLYFILGYIAYNLFVGMFTNADNVAHISGLFFGTSFILIKHYYKN